MSDVRSVRITPKICVNNPRKNPDTERRLNHNIHRRNIKRSVKRRLAFGLLPHGQNSKERSMEHLKHSFRHESMGL